MSEKLKPCPFCGGKAIMVTFHKEKVLTDYPEYRDKIRTMPSKWIRMGCDTPDCILYADVEAHTVKLGFLGGCEEEATEKWNRRAKDEFNQQTGIDRCV